MKKTIVFVTLLMLALLAVFSQVGVCHHHGLLDVMNCFCQFWLFSAVFIVTFILVTSYVLISAVQPYALELLHIDFVRYRTGRAPPPIYYRRFNFKRPPPFLR